MKQVLIISDLHCGNYSGLTPFSYISNKHPLRELAIDFYDWFIEAISKYKIDICICNGDAIDGEGKKETIDLLTTDVNIQINMACEILEKINAGKYYFTYGTPYHVTSSMHAEEIIADKMKGVIQRELDIDVYGKLLNFRHSTSKTSVPYGQGTLIAKRGIWNLINSVLEDKRKADVVIRSHIHEKVILKNNVGISASTPALELPFTEYGLKCEGFYNVGFFVLDIYPDGKIDIHEEDYKIKSIDKIIYS